MTTKRQNRITFREELRQCGYLQNQLKELVLYHFDSMDECAEYFGCSVGTVRRWMDTNKWPVPAARLLLIKHRGFLPTTKTWSGFQIRGDYLATPYGKSIHAKDLEFLHVDFDSSSNYPVKRYRRTS